MMDYYSRYIYDYCCHDCVNLTTDKCIYHNRLVSITHEHIDKCINDNLYERS